MSEVTALIAEIKSKGLLRAGDKLEELYVVAARIQAENLELKAQRDALAAKGMELAREAAHVYEKYNAAQMPDMDLIDFQTIQEFSDLSGGYIPAWSYLNSVRAEGVDKAIEHLHEKFSSTGHIGVPVMALESLADQLRAGKDDE